MLFLSIISKIIERVVKFRLMDHLTSISLLNSHQSAYCKHHSTETALFVIIHDHLVSAIVSLSIMPLLTRPLSCFRHYWPWHLDHPSLILVWYPWLCSQLVQVISVISLLPYQMWNWPVVLVHILLRCPPTLCPWSCTLRHVAYTTRLSTLISSCSLNHHLYADNTQSK